LRSIQEAAGGGGAPFDPYDPKQASLTSHPGFLKNLYFVSYGEMYPWGSFPSTSRSSTAYARQLQSVLKDTMNVYKNMGFGFELQPSHYLAWV